MGCSSFVFSTFSKLSETEKKGVGVQPQSSFFHFQYFSFLAPSQNLYGRSFPGERDPGRALKMKSIGNGKKKKGCGCTPRPFFFRF